MHIDYGKIINIFALIGLLFNIKKNLNYYYRIKTAFRIWKQARLEAVTIIQRSNNN